MRTDKPFFLQPILMGMRQKAQSRQSYPEGARAYDPHADSIDELAIFRGRTGLVMPKRPLEASTSALPPSNIRLPSIPNLLHPAPAEVISPSDPRPSYRSDPQHQPVYVADTISSTSAGLPLNWEGLYREIPESTYSYGPGPTYSYAAAAGPTNQSAGDMMLEDRWSSFMHHYAMTGDVPARTHY
jgi:hypothetical protein